MAREKIKISSEKFEKMMGAKIKLEMMEDYIEEMILRTIKAIMRF